MTTQYVILKNLPAGLAFTSAKLFAVAAPDTVVTGNTFSFSNRTNATSQYVVSIDRSPTALQAGDYTLIAYIGTAPRAELNCTFAGTDGETATETPEAAVLNTAYLFDDGAGRLAIRANVTHYQGTLQGNGDLPQKLDNIYNRIGAPAGDSIAADIAAIGGTDWTEEQREYILEQLALLTVSGASVVVTAGVYMCARGDVEQVYGNANTATWADLNNNQDANEITSRINYHIAIADNYIRSVLTQGAWVMPVEGDTIPAILAYNCARLAGVLLYEGRGVTDYDPKGKAIHQLSNHKNGVDSFLKSVVYGSTDLSPLVKSSTNEAPTAS